MRDTEHLDRSRDFAFFELSRFGANSRELYEFMKQSRTSAHQILASENTNFYALIPEVMQLARINDDKTLLRFIFSYGYLVAPKTEHPLVDPIPEGYIMKPSQFAETTGLSSLRCHTSPLTSGTTSWSEHYRLPVGARMA